jgi:hypothetical protein
LHKAAAAEAKCTVKRTGSLPWSPELDKVGKRYLYWKLHLREFTSRITNVKQLEKLATTLEIPQAEQDWLASKSVLLNCRNAQKAFTAVKKDTAATREVHMAEQAKLLAALHKWTEAAAAKSIAAGEKASHDF